MDRSRASAAWLDDVYASAPHRERPEEPAGPITLRLMAEPDPSLLPRVGGLLGSIGVVPAKLSFLLLAEDLAMISIEVRGLTAHSADLLHRKLAALPQCIPAEA